MNDIFSRFISIRFKGPLLMCYNKNYTIITKQYIIFIELLLFFISKRW